MEIADRRAEHALQKAVEEDNPKAVAEALVYLGGPDDVRWTEGFATAQTAVARGHLECFQLILQRLGQAFPIVFEHRGGAHSEDEEIDERHEAEEELAENDEEAPERTDKHILHQWRLLFSAVQEMGSKAAMRLFLSSTPERILMSVNCIGKLLQQFAIWKEETELLLKTRGSPALIVRAFASLRRWGMEGSAREVADLLLDHCPKEAFLRFNGRRPIILSSVMEFCNRIPEDITMAVLEAAPVELFRCHDNSSAARRDVTSCLWTATLRGTDAIFEKVVSLSSRESVLPVNRRQGSTVFHGAILHKAPLERIKRIFELSGNDRYLLEMLNDTGLTPLQLVLRNHTPEVLEWLLEIEDASVFDKMIETNVLHCSILDSGSGKHWINFETALRVVKRQWPSQLPGMLSEQCKPPPSLPWNPLPHNVLSALVLKCEASQVETVLELMSEVCPAAIASADKETGATALHWAVHAKSPAMVALLLPLFDFTARSLRSPLFMDCTALEVAEKMKDDSPIKEDIVRQFGPRAKAAE